MQHSNHMTACQQQRKQSKPVLCSCYACKLTPTLLITNTALDGLCKTYPIAASGTNNCTREYTNRLIQQHTHN